MQFFKTVSIESFDHLDLDFKYLMMQEETYSSNRVASVGPTNFVCSKLLQSNLKIVFINNKSYFAATTGL